MKSGGLPRPGGPAGSACRWPEVRRNVSERLTDQPLRDLPIGFSPLYRPSTGLLVEVENDSFL